jgi:hypothetical protein
MPGLGFTCKNCEEKNKPEAIEKELQRQGYGYKLADQDGYDGGKVTPVDHKEEEFFEAARQLLHARKIEENEAGKNENSQTRQLGISREA